MTSYNRKLVRQSIKHWERMRDADDFEERPISSECPLCNTYGEHITCAGCPIAKAVKDYSCGGTPYTNAYGAFRDAKADPCSKTKLAKWRKCADAEITFLKSLLKKKEKDD